MFPENLLFDIQLYLETRYGIFLVLMILGYSLCILELPLETLTICQ